MHKLFYSSRYIVRGSRGDFNLPGAVWQDLHADVWKEWLIDPAPTEWSDSGRLNYRDLPIFYVVVNFNVINITALNAPIRQIPMTQHSQQVKLSQIAYVGSIFLHTFSPGFVINCERSVALPLHTIQLSRRGPGTFSYVNDVTYRANYANVGVT